MIIYMPEDESLVSQPILDHDGGDFTKRMIVGPPGEAIVLRNSDEIGHTIYAQSEIRERLWDVDFMPANTTTSRAISWKIDEFAELKCKLHLYMQAWAGAIKTRYYKIIDLPEHQQEIHFTYAGFPADFSQVKIWMPEYDPIALSIQAGEQVSMDLVRKGKVRGKLVLKMAARRTPRLSNLVSERQPGSE